jgi:predicted kinase
MDANDQKARLVIVTGAPATGKSTIAAALGTELGLPVISKDLVKNALLESIGAASLTESRELGRAAFSVLFATAADLIATRVSLILEAPFQAGLSEASLRPLANRAMAVVIVCSAQNEVILRRYQQRAISRTRHAGHFDLVRPEMYEIADFRAPELEVPELVVDTSYGYKPPFPVVVEWISRNAPTRATFQ